MSPEASPPPPRESLASWLGINRAMLAVLVITLGLGLTEELWRNFIAIHLQITTEDLNAAVGYVGVLACLVNLCEGFGYILGGTVAHRLGPRIALAASAAPMVAGFLLMLFCRQPWAIVLGALLYSNWEPLSVPATFDVVGSEVPKDRRTIAFAVQSIHKRLPKVLGPLIGTLAFAVGFWLNLTLAFAVLVVAVTVQWALASRMKPKPDPDPIPLKEVLRRIPPDLRMLLTAEILLRWGDWFVRDFAALYVVYHLSRFADPSGYVPGKNTWGYWPMWTSLVALVTYIPVGKLVDQATSPKPYIGLTFFLFAAFPFCLVLLPRTGMPLLLALLIAFGVNGLRELGEPARKSLIAAGFPKEIRARGIGLYWGLRSFCFFPAPLVAWFLWTHPAIGPDLTFLIGGTVGLLGTAWFWLRVRCRTDAPAPAKT
jgi:MFS family permease